MGNSPTPSNGRPYGGKNPKIVCRRCGATHWYAPKECQRCHKPLIQVKNKGIGSEKESDPITQMNREIDEFLDDLLGQ
jgi:ribosomal protein L40E